MFEIVLYVLALAFLAYSFIKDKQKTYLALKKSWHSFLSLLPAFAGVLALIGLVLTVISPEIITGALGQNTGVWGMMLTSIIGERSPLSRPLSPSPWRPRC